MKTEFKKIQHVTAAAVFLIVFVTFVRMLWPYVYSIFWAAILATIFYPFYRRIHGSLTFARLRSAHFAALITVIVVILLVVIPLGAMLGIIISQAIQTYADLNNPQTVQVVEDAIRRFANLPMVQDVLMRFDLQERLRSLAGAVANTGIQWLRVGSQNTLEAVVQMFIMLYTLYYFFINGPAWIRRIMHLLPLGDTAEQLLLQKFVSGAKATLKGTLLIGLIQGIFGGFLLLIVGISSPAFWGLVIFLFSILPAVGPIIVLGPSILYLLVVGDLWQVIFLLAGTILMGLLDNLLRPPLVGKDIQLHPLLILFGTIGGIVMFGISGVVIGPIIASLFMALLSLYEERYGKELARE